MVVRLVARVLAGRLGRPVDALAATEARLGEGDFSVRAGRSGVAEVDAVAATLDAAGDRLGRLLTRERAFSAGAPTSWEPRWPGCGCGWRRPPAPGADQEQAVADALARSTGWRTPSSSSWPWPGTPGRPVTASRWRRSCGGWSAAGTGGWPPLAADGRPLRVRVEGALSPVRASTEAVTQVMDVLVGNAAEHGDGTFTVRARAAPGGLAVEVSGEGSGVAGTLRGSSPAATAERSATGSARPGPLAGRGEGGRLPLQHAEPPTVFVLLLPGDRPADPEDTA